jgi:hypothetical protein
MRMLKIQPWGWASLTVSVACSVVAGEARATTVSFGDLAGYWPDFANGTVGDSRETIGTPNLFGGTATFDDSAGVLTGISVSYTGTFSPVATGNARVIPGDLFLNVGSEPAPIPWTP